MFYLTINGFPPVNKQIRCSCVRGKPKIWKPSSKDQARIHLLFLQAMEGRKSLCCPISWTVYIYVPIPKSATKKAKLMMMSGDIRPDTRPDDDNYTYLLSNACSGTFYDDDSRRCESHVYKFFDDGLGPRITVSVEPLNKQGVYVKKNI